jgi:hypothetical protein
MGKFRVAGYDPRNDSSPGTEAWRPGFHDQPTGFTGVILDQRPTDDGFDTCQCGCRRPRAKKALFAMGHDMKLKGILTRAHLTGNKVALLLAADDGPVLGSPYEARDFAKRYSTPKLDWQAMLDEAERKQGADVRARIEAANREILARALGVQVGDKKLIKVGRWDYTGEVLAIYSVEGGAEIEYEYTDGKGRVKTVRKPAEQEEN